LFAPAYQPYSAARKRQEPFVLHSMGVPVDQQPLLMQPSSAPVYDVIRPRRVVRSAFHPEIMGLTMVSGK